MGCTHTPYWVLLAMNLLFPMLFERCFMGNRNEMRNSVEPDRTALVKQSYLYLHCLQTHSGHPDKLKQVA